MTFDEGKRHAIAAVTPVLTYFAGRYHFSLDQIGAITSDIGYLGGAVGFAVGIWQRWGTKAVPATVVVTDTHTDAPNTTGLK